MTQEAIILSGGLGTRLRDTVSHLPKSLAPVNGRPFLDYILSYLRHYKISKITLAVGYKADDIITHYGEKYNYSVEAEPLGTGGAIRKAMEACISEEVLVMNGDSFFDIDLDAFYARHAGAKADCSLALRRVADAARYGTVHAEAGGRISAFREKSGKKTEGVINGGIYILNRLQYLAHTLAEKAFSLETEFFEKKVKELNIFGFVYEDYFIDIGIKEDYEKAQDDFKRFKYQ